MTTQTAKPTAEKAKAKEDLFGDTPATALSLEFIVTKKQKIKEIQRDRKEQHSFVHGLPHQTAIIDAL